VLEKTLSRDNPLKKSAHGTDALAVVAAGLLLVGFLLFHGAELLNSGPHLYVALAVTLAFSLLALAARGVGPSGALAGGAIAFIMAGRETRMFWVLLLVFFLTLAATRLRDSRKRQLRVAESRTGRTASQVMANLFFAGLATAAPPVHAWQLLALAAMAELAADTTSSEIGTAFPGKTVLITSWEPVAPGTDGGISIGGTLAGSAAALVVAACAFALGLITLSGAAVVTAAAILGALVDSFLGALLERRGRLNNDAVNLLSTGAALGIASLLIMVL